MKTNILIADAHTLTREGLKSILNKKKDVNICGEAINSNDLQKKINILKPEIIIIDYNIPGHFSIDDIAWIKQNYNNISLLIITTNNNKQDVLKILEYGVNSYLLKECDENEVINAVNASVKKEKFFCGRVMDAILQEVTNKCDYNSVCNNCQAVTLSNREEEIIKHIAEGLTTKEIATKLHLSFHTISTHRKNIFKKLEIRNSSELINYALKKGIVNF